MLERIDNPLRASNSVVPTEVKPIDPAVVKLSNARLGEELVIVLVSQAEPALLAHLSRLGLVAGIRLTVRKCRADSAVMTIRIRDQAEELHLGSVASDALWVKCGLTTETE